jgi:uncharacterized RDD family membrane protein YckC
MRQVFNTSVGTVEVLVDRKSRTMSIRRLNDHGIPVAAAIESSDHVDLMEVLTRRIGIPISEASRVATTLGEQELATSSLAARVGQRPDDAGSWRRLENAGIPLRFVAVLLDGIIVLFPLSVLVGLMAGGGYAERGSGYANAGVEVGGSAIWLLLALAVVYYVGCEAATGMTLGKRMVGIRVVDEEGDAITVGAAIVRNLLRLVDALFFYLVGFVLALMSPRGQRLGDRAARTIVVRN